MATAGAKGEPTARQAEVLAAVRDYRARHGYSPTVREVGLAVGIVSHNGMMCHLAALRRKGLVRWDGGRSRTIVPAGDAPITGAGPPPGPAPEKRPPTPRQAEALALVRESIASRGVPPTVREVALALGVQVYAAAGYLRRLEERGHIRTARGKARAIVLL